MIRIKNYFDQVPKPLSATKLLKGQKEKDVLQPSIIAKLVDEKQNHNPKNPIYGRKEVKERLSEIYQNRCAYCESHINEAAYLEVEHYRPKKPYNFKNSDEQNHSGYYYLTYEWTNLLLACPVCNGKAHKTSRFPIIGQRANETHFIKNGKLNFDSIKIASSYLSEEIPLLLHPVLDNPADYLEFHADGTVTARDAKLKGGKSIQYYGLSDLDKRSILIWDRKEIVEDVRKKVRHSIAHFKNDNRFYLDVLAIIAYLVGKLEPKNKLLSPYSAMYRTCIERFEDFFIHSETIYTAEQKEQLQLAVARVRAELEKRY